MTSKELVTIKITVRHFCRGYASKIMGGLQASGFGDAFVQIIDRMRKNNLHYMLDLNANCLKFSS